MAISLGWFLVFLQLLDVYPVLYSFLCTFTCTCSFIDSAGCWFWIGADFASGMPGKVYSELTCLSCDVIFSRAAINGVQRSGDAQGDYLMLCPPTKFWCWEVAYDGHCYWIYAVCDVTIWRHIKVLAKFVDANMDIILHALLSLVVVQCVTVIT